MKLSSSAAAGARPAAPSIRLATLALALSLGGLPITADAAPARRARFPTPTTVATDCTNFLTASERAVYWVTRTGISQKLLPSGPTTELVHEPAVYGEIIAASNAIWFVTDQGLQRIDESGANRTIVTRRPASRIAVDNHAVYWIEITGKYELWAADHDGGAVRKLGEETDEVARIAASGDHVYMMTAGSEITAIAKAGGVVEHLASQPLEFPSDIAANANRVVWSSGPMSTIEQIMSGRDTVLFEDQSVETERVAITSGGTTAFATKDGHQHWTLQLLPPGIGKPAPPIRETDRPIGDRRRARRLPVQVRGIIRQLAVNSRDELLWAEEPYEGPGCAIRALTLP
jgi:hypothetical protein